MKEDQERRKSDERIKGGDHARAARTARGTTRIREKGGRRGKRRGREARERR